MSSADMLVVTPLSNQPEHQPKPIPSYRYRLEVAISIGVPSTFAHSTTVTS